MTEKTPTLTFNRATGYYEGALLIQVDAEIFRRLLLREVEQDATADFTDPQTWIGAIERVGKIENWLHKPHVKVTPVAAMPMPAQQAVKSSEPSPPKLQQPTLAMRLEARLREVARQVPPYLWDERCLTPIGDMTLPPKERADIGRLRYDERKVLKKLREEWEQGTLLLTPDAQKQEEQYQNMQQTGFATKLETVASAVNGNRIR